MAGHARIRNLEGFRGSRSDELERVRADVDVRNSLLDFGHMASDALAAALEAA